MRKAVLTSVLVLTLTGCIDSKYYYHISSEERWKSYSYCGGPLEKYEKDLGDAGSLFLLPYRKVNGTTLEGTTLGLSYDVITGSVIQLVDTSIAVQTGKANEAIKIPISQFTSGMEWEHIPKKDWVKTRIFDATDQLIGYGRFSHDSQPSQRNERYYVEFTLSKEKLDWFKVDLPAVMANNTLVKLKPVIFEYKEGRYLACFQ